MKRRWPIVLGLIALTLLAAPGWLSPGVRIVYNASDSAPRGWYRITRAAALRTGEDVLALLPDAAATLAAQRGYLPLRVPVLKRIAAVASQRVCVRGGVVSIDGVAVAVAMPTDGQDRQLSAWDECRHLSGDELFLLGVASATSFDSRYFGPVSASSVIGHAQPLWTWNTR